MWRPHMRRLLQRGRPIAGAAAATTAASVTFFAAGSFPRDAMRAEALAELAEPSLSVIGQPEAVSSLLLSNAAMGAAIIASSSKYICAVH